MAQQRMVHPAIKELMDSDRHYIKEASPILLTFANNVLSFPNEPKYRRIRLGNPKVMEKLLPAPGAMEILFAMGFEETEDREFLCLPQPCNLTNIRRLRNQLKSELEALQDQTVFPRPPPEKVPKPTAQSENEFMGRVMSTIRRVHLYENPTAQAAALGKIPSKRLMEEAKQKLEAIKASGESSGSPGLDLRDCLLLATLSWFKREFFSWVDCLPCERCGGPTQHSQPLVPTDEEIRWGGASRVEGHQCPACGHVTRFPRFTNAVRLLSTRRGRCGEWADCFTLVCRALGYEARYVLDWTDHVWTEVYSNSQKRWLHCDPCEATCDKPLLYESGWGKKLTYVIAFSKDEVQDVSWRYSAKHKEMLERRNLCRESWLRRLLYGIWKRRMHDFSEEWRKELSQRLVVELSEFLAPPTKPGEALPGRTTGSVAWRQARGEMGDANTNNSIDSGYVFKPTEKEIEKKQVLVKYSSASDTYERTFEGSTAKGWGAWIHKAENGFRKEETDHQMAYLARQDGTRKGELCWRFEAGSGQKFLQLSIRAACAVFGKGQLQWRLCAGSDLCVIKTGEELTSGVNVDLQGSNEVVVTAVLRGGEGEVAWQHAQVFRQALSDAEPAMEIRVTLAS